MALTDIISIGVKDADGDHKTVPIFVPSGVYTPAEITAYAQELASDLDAITDMKIDEITMTLRIALPGGLKASPIALSEVQKGALISYSAENTTYKHSTFLPGVTPSLFNGDVLTLAGDVVTFNDAVVGGFLVGATTVEASDKDGNDLTDTVKATKRFRK